jgi:hypothetical protein
LLGLIAQNPVTDASLGGFLSGVAVVVAFIGVGAMSYVLVTAKRAGFLGIDEVVPPVRTPPSPSGMRAVPAVPATLGPRKRQQIAGERSVRNRQAKAIATAQVTSRTRRRQPSPAARVRPVATGPAPVRMPAPARNMTRPAPVRVAPSAPVRMAPARVAPPAPVRTQPVARPPIRMPQPSVRSAHPMTSPPLVPVMRMGRPPMHPSGQVALHQVHGANVHVPPPAYRR